MDNCRLQISLLLSDSIFLQNRKKGHLFKDKDLKEYQGI